VGVGDVVTIMREDLGVMKSEVSSVPLITVDEPGITGDEASTTIGGLVVRTGESCRVLLIVTGLGVTV
jgi:hypothetical protein